MERINGNVINAWEKMENNSLIDIQRHCFRLGELLSKLDPYAFILAVDWLTIASGVESVKVSTAKHDQTVLYCRGAFEYEEKRSLLLSHLTTNLTIFNFVWGSFESIAKVLQSTHLPKPPKRWRGSIVNRTIWSLEQNYGTQPSLAFYRDYLGNLCKYIGSNKFHEFYSEYKKEFKPPNFSFLPGLGLHIVRKIRNNLAHGSATMPLPDDWGEQSAKLSYSEKCHLYLIDTCTRILLLTIQMSLLIFTRGEKIIVNCLLDAKENDVESTAQLALHQIHLDIDLMDWDQLRLFNETNLSLMDINE